MTRFPPTLRAGLITALLPCLSLSLAGSEAKPAAAADQALADDAAVDADLAALEKQMRSELAASVWDLSVETEVGVGYRSNPALAAFGADDTSVLRTTVDFMAWRLPTDRFEWVNIVDATNTHYFSGSTDDAWMFLGRSEGRWEIGPSSLWSLTGQYLYHDEVIDASSFDSGLGVTRAQVQSPTLETKWKWSVAENWDLTAQLRGEYDDFRAPLDDFTAGRAALAVERGLGRFGAVTATLAFMRRDYATREQAAAGGRLLPGTSLAVGRPEVELRHDLRGGGDTKWQLTSKLGYKENNDNGSGWYDYQQTSADVSFSVDHGPWNVEVDLGWDGYLYKLQRVGFGDPPRRTHDDWSAFLRVERKFAAPWTAFVEIDFERSQSNDVFLVYDDTLALMGVRWSR